MIEGFQWGGQLMITSDVENDAGSPDESTGRGMLGRSRAQAESLCAPRATENAGLGAPTRGAGPADMPGRDATGRVCAQSFTFVDGYLHPGEKPGLGVDLDVDEAGQYPYQGAYLPFNRLHDRTVHAW